MDNFFDKEKGYCYKYPHAALTVDCVVFGFDGERLKVLLIERDLEPYAGMWALPGGFMNIDETLENAARRELREETNLTDMYLEQFHVFSSVNRDPRERVVTVAFLSLIRQDKCGIPVGGSDARRAMWFDEQRLPPLAFDHREIIELARQHLSEVIRLRPVAFRLLNKVFSVSELQRVYELINHVTYDRRNFQRKLMQADILDDRGVAPVNKASRPPRLYSLKDRIASFMKPDTSAGSNTENADDGIYAVNACAEPDLITSCSYSPCIMSSDEDAENINDEEDLSDSCRSSMNRKENKKDKDSDSFSIRNLFDF